LEEELEALGIDEIDKYLRKLMNVYVLEKKIVPFKILQYINDKKAINLQVSS